MVKDRLFRDIVSAFESAEPAYRAGTIDEYRELAMLARAWERGSLEPGVADERGGPPLRAPRGTQ